MKRIEIYFITLLPFYTLSAEAQDLKILQPSTLQQIQQDFGPGQITITYSRPNIKGRKIFGNIEPYGIVWRTGANAATKIRIIDMIRVEGHLLAPGEYGLFTIPGANEWTVIFNSTAVQWGLILTIQPKMCCGFK
jgi:hypothetical protein